MRSVAILSCGPSAKRVGYLCPRYRSVYVVNNATEIRGCYDWWIAGDVECITTGLCPSANPRVGIVTMANGIDAIRAGGAVPRLGQNLHLVDWRHARQLIPADMTVAWTLTVALCWAAAQGAQTVDCYGVDWQGDTDCTGRAEAERVVTEYAGGETRWPREARETRRLVEYLTTHRGMCIRRLSPTEEELPWKTI